MELCFLTNCLSVEPKNGSSLLIKDTNENWLSVAVLTSGGFRIEVGKSNQSPEHFSYATLENISFEKPDFEDKDNEVIIRSAHGSAQINKNPIRISFFDVNGSLLSKEDEGLGSNFQGHEASCYRSLLPNERFIGLGEKTGNLDKRGMCYTNWNTDQFAYGPDSDPMYASIPFFMGLHDNGVYGIYLDSSWRTFFNFGASNHRYSQFSTDGGTLKYYFFCGLNPKEILYQYSNLTGTTALPPLWSLGYQQCRYSYYPECEIELLADTFRAKKIPADVLYFDIHYMERYKVFTWHKDRFPDPTELHKKLENKGFKSVVIVDPGVKIEEGYNIMESGVDEDVFVKYPDGELYRGEAWPGWCHFPDFTHKKTRDWWANKFEIYTEQGVGGVWNDMNEPAVWGKHFPDITLFNYDNHPTTHKKAHNVYGMLMARASREGLEKARPQERPFILTRAAFAGIQRYAAVWTGDNMSNNDHYFLGQRMVNALGLSGVANCGNDVGGFIGECAPDLFARWVQLGAFNPFFRGHSMINSRDAEPWSFGEEAEEIARNYINLRYKLMPYLYETFKKASETGSPINKSLVLDYHKQAEIFDFKYQNEFIFGESILVCPVEPGRDLHKIFLPNGETWVDFFNDEIQTKNGEVIIETKNDKLPVFVKQGSVIPMQSLVQSTAEQHDGTLYLHVYTGGENICTARLYEDDGISNNYLNDAFSERLITHNASERKIDFSAACGKFNSKFKTVKIYLHNCEKVNENQISTDSKLTIEDFRFLEPISHFDPWMAPDNKHTLIKDLACLEMSLDSSSFSVKY
jgi:alpha-glucosidase